MSTVMLDAEGADEVEARPVTATVHTLSPRQPVAVTAAVSAASTTPLQVPNAALAPAAATRSTGVARARDLGTLAVGQAVYRLRRLGIATLCGVAALVAAATIFMAYNLPQGNAVSALQAQVAHAPPVAAIAGPTGPTLASLPPRSDAPDVVGKIYEEAKAAGVELPRGQYEYVPPRDGVAARYRLTFPVHASYPQIRGFLDRTLIALPAVAVEGLRIERKNVADGNVDAEVRFAAYVRGEP